MDRIQRCRQLMNLSWLIMTVTEGSQKAFRILAQRPELAPAGASGYLIKILKLKKFKPLSASQSEASGYSGYSAATEWPQGNRH